ALPARLLDVAGGLLRVLVLVEIGDEDVGALAGEGDGDRAADAGIGAGDDRRLAGQLAGPAVALLPVVGLRGHLAQRAGRGLLLLGLGLGAGLGHGVPPAVVIGERVRGLLARAGTSPVRLPAERLGNRRPSRTADEPPATPWHDALP